MKLIINATGREIEIQEGNNLIGRWDPQEKSFPEIDLEEDDIDAKISRRHCVIQKNGDTYYIEDVGSLNGTYLNNVQLLEGDKTILRVGDEILIGKILLKFEE